MTHVQPVECRVQRWRRIFAVMRWTATEHREIVGRSFMLAREALGMKPTDFARRLGITAQALWNIERGRAYPAPIVIVRACEEFGLSADWFMLGERGGLPRDLADKLHAAETRHVPV